MKFRAGVATLLICATLTSPVLRADGDGVDPRLVAAIRQAVLSASAFANRLDAVYWLADMSLRLEAWIPDPYYRIDLLNKVYAESARADLDPQLVLALIEVESQFDRFAVSRSGARGLMQIMPFWIKEIGHPADDLFLPQTNLRYGCTILKHYLELSDGDVVGALTQYNGGPDKVAYAGKVIAALDVNWRARTQRM